MSRYWVNLLQLNDETEQAERELDGLANAVAGSCLVYKTEDWDDAKETAMKAREILQSIFPDNPVPYVDAVSITRQPECPECGFLGRFSARECPMCQTVMTPKKTYEM